MKYVIFQGRILVNPSLGIYAVMTWYSDGSQDLREVPLGPILIPKTWMYS